LKEAEPPLKSFLPAGADAVCLLVVPLGSAFSAFSWFRPVCLFVIPPCLPFRGSALSAFSWFRPVCLVVVPLGVGGGVCAHDPLQP
jgi:hypothetical protein